MPVYEYRCPKCSEVIELQQKMSEKIAPFCFKEGCDGNVEMESIFSKTSFQLKGAGWFRDGYASKK